MPIVLEYTFMDEKGAEGSTEINAPSSLAMADLILFAADMALMLDDLTTGVITGITASFPLTLPGGIKATAAVGSDKEEGARFSFTVTGGVHKTAMRIPTFNEDFIVTGGKLVDLEATEVATFVDAMIDGIDPAGGATGIIQPVDKRNTDIVALFAAKENFQASKG